MKRLLVMMMGIFVLAAPLFASPVAGSPEGSPDVPGFKIKLWIMIEFGRKSLDCLRFGICDIDGGIIPLASKTLLPTNEAYGEGYFDDDGKLVIEFAKEYMRTETITNYFNSKFVVEEDFEIPRELLDKFKHTGSYTIKTGQYSFTDKNGRLITKF